MNRVHTVLLAFAASSLLYGAHAQTSSGKAELARESLKPSVDRLIQVVSGAVTEAGGDLARSQAHWVMAFSTGHYKADPLGAQAVRELASQFVARQAVTGDQVTARAWEMTGWTYRNPAALTLPIGTDAAADRARAAGLWPTTPAVGSVGGHDTERVATELAREFQADHSAVLILLTNTAASVGAAGSKLLGTNAPEYQAMLQDWTRVGGTQDGATLNLPYRITSPRGEVPGQLQAVVFVPKTFTSAVLARPRAELLTAAKPDRPTGGGSGSAAGVLLGLLALGGLAFFAYRLLAGGGKSRGSVRVGDHEFALQDAPKNRPFCMIAGSGYASETHLPVVTLPGFPPEALAELSLSGRELRIQTRGEPSPLSSVGGRVPTGDRATVPLRADTPDTELHFNGEVAGPGGVPRQVNRTLTISYLQEA